jgi:hypothetical protein
MVIRTDYDLRRDIIVRSATKLVISVGWLLQLVLHKQSFWARGIWKVYILQWKTIKLISGQD